MKKLLLLILIVNLFQQGEVVGQNLVPNGSFETITQCPADVGFIYFAPPWFQPSIRYGNTSVSSSSDLYDTCSNFTTAGIPTNYFGYQTARTGHSYAGIFFQFDTFNYREYIEVPMLSPLIANKKYCVQFYVSLADSSTEAVSNFGVYFSVDSLLDSTPNANAINYVTPQFENPVSNIVTDTVNWVLISGNFIANGGEKFMTIGNFHNQATTNSQNVAPSSSGGLIPSAYYYIDDISVIFCDPSGINELPTEETISIYPNPASNQLGITNYELGIKEVRIYNVLGEEVIRNYELGIKNATIDIHTLPKGVYFVEVLTEQGIIRKKFLKE